MDTLEGPIYFDTNVFIYSIEAHDDYLPVIHRLFKQIYDQQVQVITSEITLAECLVKPIKDGNEDAIQHYENSIKNNDMLLVKPITRSILKESAYVRNDLRLKLPDAIHMATAIDQGCKLFITNDKKLKAPSGMKQVYLKELLLDLPFAGATHDTST